MISYHEQTTANSDYTINLNVTMNTYFLLAAVYAHILI